MFPNTLLITGGTVWTGDGPVLPDQAVLLSGKRIVTVGNRSEITNLACARNVVKLELNGETVLPGLSDAHVHLTAYAKQQAAVDLFNAKSKQETLSLLYERANSSKTNEWVYGYRYKESNWDIQEEITGEDLDSLNVPNPIHIVRVCGHVHVANKKACELGGGYRGSSGKGVFFENQADGIVRAMEAKLYSKQGMQEAILSASRDFASYGITSVHACSAQTYGLGEDLDVLQGLDEAEKLSLRVTFYDEKFPSLGVRSGFGNPFLRYGGFKIFLDGALGPRTAALTAPYHDDPNNSGILNHTLKDVVEMLQLCQERKIQAQVHAIGDAAIDMFLDAIEKTGDQGNNPFGASYRLNHLQLCRPDQVSRISKLKPVCDIQPAMIPSDLAMLPSRLGSERKTHGYFCKSLISSGLIVNGSSDAGCDVMNPWRAIWAAINRTDDSGNPPEGWRPEEKINLWEALKIYTQNPPRTVGMGFSTGKIAPGYLADLAILDRNIFEANPQELQEVTSKFTFIDGNLSCGSIDKYS